MENDDDVRKSLLAGTRRSQTENTATRTGTYYDMQQPSSTTVSRHFREILIGLIQGRLATAWIQ